MLIAYALPAAVALFAQASAVPEYFTLVALILLAAGALGALVATVLGFSRAQAFGGSARWFALSALCLLLYHVQFLVFALVAFATASQNNFAVALSLGAFFNLFIVLAAVCAVMGFVRLTDGR